MNSIVIGTSEFAPAVCEVDDQCLFAPNFTSLRAPGISSHPDGTTAYSLTVTDDGTIRKGGELPTSNPSLLTAAGQLLSHDGSSVIAVDPGTEGQILSVGPGPALEWTTPAAGVTLPISKGVIISGDGSASTTLAVGGDNQVLTVDSSTDTGLKWADLPDSVALPISKGVIISGDGSASANLTVGSNGQVLIADSAETTGLKWGDLSVSTGTWTPSYTAGANVNTVTSHLARYWKSDSDYTIENFFVFTTGATSTQSYTIDIRDFPGVPNFTTTFPGTDRLCVTMGSISGPDIEAPSNWVNVRPRVDSGSDNSTRHLRFVVQFSAVPTLSTQWWGSVRATYHGTV